MLTLANPRLHVTSKLMQDYRIAYPLTGETTIASVIDPTGMLMLISITKDGDVFGVFPIEGSSTGWSVESLNFKYYQPDGAQPKLVAAGSDKDGICVFVCDANNVMHMSRVSRRPQNEYVDTGGYLNESSWISFPNKSLDPSMTFSIEQIELGYDQDANLLLTVRKRFTNKGQSVSDNVYWIDYKNPDNPWQEISQASKAMGWRVFRTLSDYKIVTRPPAGVPVGSNGVAIYMAGDFLTDPTNANGSHTNNLQIVAWPDAADSNPAAMIYYGAEEQHGNTFLSIASAPDAPAGETGGVYSIQQPGKGPSPERTLVYCSLPHNANDKVVPIGKDVKFQSMVASRDANGLAEVFALTASNTLFHVRQHPPQQLLGLHSSGDALHAPAGWQDGIEIMTTPQLTKLSVVRGHDGISHLLAIAVDGSLYHIWQDKDSTDWNRVLIEFEGDDNESLEKFASYWTEITVYDDDRVATANRQVKIFSDNDVTLNINGALIVVNPDTPWTGMSNMSGQVVVSMETNSLAAHALTVWTDFMPETDRVAIDPSGYIQTRLENLQKDTDNTPPSADTLFNAKVKDDQGNETYLLTEAKGNRNLDTANQVVDAIHQVMTLARRQTPSATPNSKFLHPRSNMQVASYIPEHDGTYPNLIDVAAVREQHWQLDCSSGKPVFRSLTRDEAVALLAGQQHGSASAAKGFGLPDIDLEWGDVVDAVEEGVATFGSEIQSIVVSTVVDPLTQLVDAINAKIQIAIDGINYVWEGTISIVEQAYDMMKMVFHTIKVLLGDLLGWLGFVFNWSDILRTKEVVKHSINQTFDLFQGMLQYLQNRADNFFTELDSEASALISAMISSELGSQSLVDLGKEGTQKKPEGLDDSMVGNIFLSGFTNHAPSTPSQPVGLPGSLFVSLQSIQTQLTQAGESLAQTTVFQNAQAYFSQAAAQLQTNPQYALQLTIAGMLATVQPLVSLGIHLVKEVVDLILDALDSLVGLIKGIINTTWEIPFISSFYSNITSLNNGTSQPNKLTALDLMSIIVAIPTTAFYKMKYDRAPFPSDSSVTQFKSSFTAQAILSAGGLATSSNSPVPKDAERQLSSKSAGPNLKALAVMNLVFSITYGLSTGAADFMAFSMEGAKPNKAETAFSISSLLFGAGIWITGCPWFSNSEAPQPNTPNGMANLVWLGLLPGMATDFLVFTLTLLPNLPGGSVLGKKLSLNGNTGPALSTAFGVVNVALYAKLADVQRKANQYSHETTAGNMVSALPLILKFFRLEPIATYPIYGQIALAALSIYDVEANVSAGVLCNWSLLKPSAAQAAQAV